LSFSLTSAVPRSSALRLVPRHQKRYRLLRLRSQRSHGGGSPDGSTFKTKPAEIRKETDGISDAATDKPCAADVSAIGLVIVNPTKPPAATGSSGKVRGAGDFFFITHLSRLVLSKGESFMTIVIFDGHAINPGDLSWDAIGSLGSLEVFDRTPENAIVPRAREAVLTTRTPLSAHTLAELARLRYVGAIFTGFDEIDLKAARERHIPRGSPDQRSEPIIERFQNTLEPLGFGRLRPSFQVKRKKGKVTEKWPHNSN